MYSMLTQQQNYIFSVQSFNSFHFLHGQDGQFFHNPKIIEERDENTKGEQKKKKISLN